MVLIAIDKHSRKILGYLCKNDQTVAYCCSECDVEFSTAFELEEHMITHEQKSSDEIIQQIPCVHDEKSDETQNEEPEEALPEEKDEVEEPPKQLSSVERENLLMIKYQVKPCTVLLDRDDRYLSGTLDIDAGGSIADQESTSSETQMECIVMPNETSVNESTEATPFETTDDTPNEPAESPKPSTSKPSMASEDDIPLQQLKRKRLPPKKPADLIPTDELISAKRRKTPTLKTNLAVNKKPMKPKPSPQKSVCFLCGSQFATSIQLTQHQKTHFASTISNAPVFPCNICGRKVKNLKIHLRLHKKENKEEQPQQKQQRQRPPSANGKVMKGTGKRSKSNESQKLNGSTKSGCVTKGARAKLAVGSYETTSAVETTVGLLPTVLPSDTFVKRAEASSSTDAVFSKPPCESNEEAELISSNEVLTANSNDSSSYNLIDDCVTDTDALLLFADSIMLPPPPSSSTSCVAIIDPSFAPSAIDPLSMDGDPLEMPSILDLEPISVNEPSQSTSITSIIESYDDPKPVVQSNAEDTFQPNGLKVDKRKKKHRLSGEHSSFKCLKCSRYFDTLDLMTKHSKKHDEKMNCEFCGKLLAKSYMYFHISKYHKTKDDIGNIPLAAAEEQEDDEVEDEETMMDDDTPTMAVETRETQEIEEQEAAA